MFPAWEANFWHNWRIGHWKGHPRTPGMDFIYTVLRPHLLSPRADRVRPLWRKKFRPFLDYIRVWQGLLRKLHWFPYLGLCCLYGIEYLFTVGVRISWKKLRCRERWWLRCHLVPPTLYSSRKISIPLPPKGNGYSEGRGVQKDAISEGEGGGFLRFFN